MAVNRFYQGSASRYQSQFVPQQLPVDAMTAALYAKQGTADQMLAAAVKLGEWKQVALGWHDQEYVKGIKNEIQDFVSRAMTEDRTSPEFQRQYLELTNRIKNDENLKLVESAVMRHTEHEANIAKLKAAGQEAYAEALDADYQYRLNEYTKEGGQGFKGLALGDENIRKGTNIFKDALEFFTPLKESGSEGVKFLEEGISYKNGWTGISDNKVKEQANRQYNLWVNTDAGNQLRLQELQKRGLVETTYNDLPLEKRKELDKEIDNTMRNEFLEVGRTVVHGNSTTNIDQAYNTRRKEYLEKEKEIGVIIPTNETPYTQKSSYAGRDKKINELSTQINNISQQIHTNQKRIKQGLPSEYTAASLRALEAQEASLIRRRDLLRQEKNQDWQNIANAQKKLYQNKFNKLSKQENQLLASLKGKISQDQYNILAESITRNPETGSYSNLVSTSGVLEEMINGLPITANNGTTRATLRKLAIAEKQKEAMSANARRATSRIWNETYNKVGTVTSTVEMSGASTRTDDQSTMAAVNKDVLVNSDVYNFYNSNGDIIDINDYGGASAISKFNGQSVTNGDFKNKGEIGINGVMTFQAPVLDALGQKVYDKNNVLKTKSVTLSVNAVPVGSRNAFLKQSWANEQWEVARIKDVQGQHDQAKVARAHAINLNKASIYQDLVNFQASDEPITTVTASAYTPDGKGKGVAEFVIRKVGTVGSGGGYQVSYGTFMDEFEDINAANAYIQTLTNSTPNLIK